MKRSFLIFALPFCAVTVAAGAPRCSVHDVSGVYAFHADGSVLVPDTPITGPFSRIGYIEADGKGGLKIAALALYNGINFGFENFTGTYSVTSDCALDLQANVPAPVFALSQFKGQVSLGGDQITFMLVHTDNPQAPAISTVVGFGERRRGIPFGHCSDRDLDGAWRVEINGFLNLPPVGTGTPFRQVGSVNLNGRGGLLASFVTSTGGAISEATGAGTYTVSPDCTFDLTYRLGANSYTLRGSMVDRDHSAVSLNMPGTPIPTGPFAGAIDTAAIATGTLLRQTE